LLGVSKFKLYSELEKVFNKSLQVKTSYKLSLFSLFSLFPNLMSFGAAPFNLTVQISRCFIYKQPTALCAAREKFASPTLFVLYTLTNTQTDIKIQNLSYVLFVGYPRRASNPGRAVSNSDSYMCRLAVSICPCCPLFPNFFYFLSILP